MAWARARSASLDRGASGSPPPCGEGSGVGVHDVDDRVHHAVRRSRGRGRRRFGCASSPHHVAPGCARCSTCISASRWPRCSLCRPARPPVCIQRSAGRCKVASREHAIDGRVPRRLDRLAVDGDARPPPARARPRPSRTARPCTSTARPARPRAGVALLGAVAQPDHPFGRMAHMIGHLLHGLGRDLGEARVRGLLQRLQIGVHERRIEQLAHHGRGEVAVRLLDQQHVGDRRARRAGRRAASSSRPLPSISPA